MGRLFPGIEKCRRNNIHTYCSDGNEPFLGTGKKHLYYAPYCLQQATLEFAAGHARGSQLNMLFDRGLMRRQ